MIFKTQKTAAAAMLIIIYFSILWRLSRLLPLPTFESAWESLAFWGAILTIAGVVGEGAALFEKLGKQKSLWKIIWHRGDRLIVAKLVRYLRKRELFLESVSLILVVLGLLLELIGGTQAIISGREENDSLILLSDKQRYATQELWAENLATESNNLALQTNVNATKTELAKEETRLIEVRNDNLAMDIGDQYSLGEALKALTGIQVELRSAFDMKAQQTARMLETSFGIADWKIINRQFMGDIGEQGIVVGYNGDDPSVKAANLLVKTLTDRNIPARVLERERVLHVPTNSIIVAIMERPPHLKSDLMVLESKREQLSNEEREISRQMIDSMEHETNVQGPFHMPKSFTEFREMSARNLQPEIELDAKIKELRNQIDKEESRTNSSEPGLHMYDVINPSGVPISSVYRVEGGARVTVTGDHINLPPLQ